MIFQAFLTWCTPQENFTLGKYRKRFSNWQICQLEFMHRERGSTLLANHAFVYHYILYLLPITTIVVQLCPIASNKSTTSVMLVKIFSSGRSSGADLWQKCTRNG